MTKYTLFSRSGALIPFIGKPVAFRWGDSQTDLELADPAPAALLRQGQQARALTALADWYTRYQVVSSRRHAARP